MDEPGYGAGKSVKSRKWDKSISKKPKPEVRLIESDPDYPKDVPKGALYYEKFWREELREVLDQGNSNLCWNFASSASLSSRLLIQKKVKALKRLSLLHVLVGVWAKTGDKGELKDFEHLKFFLKEDGTISEQDCKCVDPFSEMKRKNTREKSKIKTPIICTHKHEPKNVFKVKDLIVINKVVEEDLILLLNEGPVAISIAKDMDFENFEGDGIFDSTKKGKAELGFHMLLCTGYGTLSGVHYWDVQNSAGKKWGDGGFGKIIRKVSRGNGEPSLIKSVIYPVLLEDYNDED